MNPGSQVADLIMQLMMRGKSGGLPMQASPELMQYLAHAQGGTLPPQMRGAQPAPVLPGPGSAMAELRDPNFLGDGGLTGQIPDNGWPPGTESFAAPYQGPSGGNVVPGPGAMDMVTDRPPPPMDPSTYKGALTHEDPNVMWIWYTNPQTGKRVRLDGPFYDDITAHRAMKALRAEGVTDELELSPS